MVFLAITPRGLKGALQEAAGSDAAIWCGADAISEEAFAALFGVNLTRFSYELGTLDANTLEGALITIQEHHPDEVVWMEAPISSS
ncbi:hypothetical protein [Pseudorhodoferax sp.]|uniref:hypothetical protein n=1 Tax=Pseudorhodoferax sp. TaxID=1993553 RepID=UPI002DD68256|nr:hypothetical protein [Pseudorhodoferax sp.]